MRIVAFRDMDLVVDEQMDNDSWPFKDETEWITHRTKIGEINVPSYDPDVHALPVHGRLNRIPTLVGLGIVLVVTGLLVLVLIATR